MSRTIAPQHPFEVNDLVVIHPDYARPMDHGVIYKVTRLLPVNIEIVPVNGGKGWRVKPHQISKAPDGAAPVPSPAVLPVLAALYPAQVVTVTGSGWKEPADKLWVVLKDGPSGKVSVARLGGDNGRYWRVPRSFVEPVEIDSVVLKPRTPADGR